MLRLWNRENRKEKKEKRGHFFRAALSRFDKRAGSQWAARFLLLL
jgi:hypothetical protein